MDSLDSNEIIQIGIVVKDIRATVENYVRLFGVDYPNIRNAFPNIVYRGKRITTKSQLCSFQLGSVSLELVQPDEDDSSWREFLDEHGEGVHHIGVIVNDLESAYATLEKMDVQKRQFGGAGWGSYTIMDTQETLGVLLNVKCKSPIIEENKE